ncbi:hypothetical protein [Spirosoma sp.]|uniref:hypothetical protein n=1 Tax=Spirosoma sp. TaxID=1899569 RepID=UPI00262C3300|nr:hypothetical protein [Spirosoma sp.]MCX6218942.1 hypothetical protein [Spirosoma sp.]
MRKKCLLAALLTWVTISKTIGQPPIHPPAGAVLDVGIRFQKSISFYTENGITAQYAHPKLVSKRLFLGLSYITSRLGTAFQSNAIKQDNFLVSAGYYFRPNWVVRPMARLNVGYFAAHYANPLFDELPKTSPLASPEFGLCYCPDVPLKINASIGYNLLTGNGVTGPGTLYPVFVQTSVTWNILKNSKN